MDPNQNFGMRETDENNITPGKAPPGFLTPVPVVGSSKPLTDKGKKVTETPQPNIFEALQHMFTPEQLRSATDFFRPWRTRHHRPVKPASILQADPIVQ